MAEHSLTRQDALKKATQTTATGLGVNVLLAITKATAGVLGNSFALIADAVESSLDVVGSLIVLTGLRVAASPPTEAHPYGKGRAETLSAVAISVALYVAAAWIVTESVRLITIPHGPPHPFTLIVLLGVFVIKELLFRFVIKTGDDLASTAVKADAWHHRSDAITSLAAAIGISIALLGGPGFTTADEWAAIFASAIIAFNATNLLIPALRELTDAVPDKALGLKIRELAATVEGVHGTHRCWVRKLGFDHYVDLDVLVKGDISVREGHDIAHAVQMRVREEMPMVVRVMVHVEPDDEFGRHRMAWEKSE